MDPIVYVSGGLLGDFINQLSVINEKYLQTGRKGILYISSHGDRFSFGVETAYKDTEILVKSQEYIHDYKIYNGEDFDIDLSLWRSSVLMTTASFPVIYNKVYGIEWGKHKWLTCANKPEYNNKILIHCSLKRLNHSINYDELLKTIPIENLLFVTMDYGEYSNFIKIINKSINLELFENFTLFIEAICSAGLFIGNLSMPLAVAFAAHRQCIALLPDGIYKEDNRYKNFPSYLNFYNFIE